MTRHEQLVYTLCLHIRFCLWKRFWLFSSAFFHKLSHLSRNVSVNIPRPSAKSGLVNLTKILILFARFAALTFSVWSNWRSQIFCNSVRDLQVREVLLRLLNSVHLVKLQELHPQDVINVSQRTAPLLLHEPSRVLWRMHQQDELKKVALAFIDFGCQREKHPFDVQNGRVHTNWEDPAKSGRSSRRPDRKRMIGVNLFLRDEFTRPFDMFRSSLYHGSVWKAKTIERTGEFCNEFESVNLFSVGGESRKSFRGLFPRGMYDTMTSTVTEICTFLFTNFNHVKLAGTDSYVSLNDLLFTLFVNVGQGQSDLQISNVQGPINALKLFVIF